MEDIKTVALLPCPFCGAPPVSHAVGGNAPGCEDCSYWAVECPNCNGRDGKAFAGAHSDEQEIAEEAWNRRAELQKDATPVGVVKELEAALRSVNAVAIERGDKFGACDQIDNAGQPYQSEWFAKLLSDSSVCTNPQPKAATVPQGWKPVPVEPTQEMHDAGRAALASGSVPMEKVYRAMLEAAPSLPAAEDARDAARYRFLRHADLDAVAAVHWPNSDVPEGEEFDRAIDAAMSQDSKVSDTASRICAISDCQQPAASIFDMCAEHKSEFETWQKAKDSKGEGK